MLFVYLRIWILVLMTVMILTQINARRLKSTNIRSSDLKPKNTSKSSVIYSSELIAQNLTTKRLTTALAKVKERPKSTTASSTVQTILTTEFTTLKHLRKSSKFTTVLATRKSFGHSLAVLSQISEPTAPSISKRIVDFTTLHAVKKSSALILKPEAKVTLQETVALKTRPAFIQTFALRTLNVPEQAGNEKILSIKEIAAQGTKPAFRVATTSINIPGHNIRRENKPFLQHTENQAAKSTFTRTSANTTTLVPKLTLAHAARPIPQTPEFTTVVPKRIPEFTTLFLSTQKHGLTTEFPTKLTKPTNVLVERQNLEQTQRKSESTDKHISSKSLKVTTKLDVESTNVFTTTLVPRPVTKSLHEQTSLSFVEFSSKPTVTPGLSPVFVAKTSPKPGLRTTFKQTTLKRPKSQRTSGFSPRFASNAKLLIRNAPKVTMTHRLITKTTIQPKYKSTIKPTVTIAPLLAKSIIITRLAPRRKSKSTSSKVNSFVSIAAAERIPRRLLRLSPKKIPRRIIKEIFSREPKLSEIQTYNLMPKITPTSGSKEQLALRTKINEPNEKNRKVSLFEFNSTQSKIRNSSPIMIPRWFKPNQSSDSELSEDIKFIQDSESSETAGFTAATTKKSTNDKLWVGLWRPWFFPDENHKQGFQLGLDENFSPGFRRSLANTNAMQSTKSQELIDDILKSIEEENLSTNKTSEFTDFGDSKIQNVSSSPLLQNVTERRSKEEIIRSK